MHSHLAPIYRMIGMGYMIRTWVPPLVDTLPYISTRLCTADPYERTRADINRSDVWKFPFSRFSPL